MSKPFPHDTLVTSDRFEAAALLFMSSRGHAVCSGWSSDGRRFAALLPRERREELRMLTALLTNDSKKGKP